MMVKIGSDDIYDKHLVMTKWKSDFESIYNPDSNNALYDNDFKLQVTQTLNQTEYEMLRIDYIENDELNYEISLNEVQYVVNKLKGKKATGIDKLPNEALKNKDIIKILTDLFKLCFKFNFIPELWLKALISPIPKGSKTITCDPMNYRGISLLSTVSKVFTGILNNRLVRYCNLLDIIVEEQNGFRKGRSCQEHIFSITTIIQCRIQEKKSSFAAFIDLEKAFDRVDRILLLYKLLCYYNVDGKFYHILKTLYSNHWSCVKINDSYTDWFTVSSGVRQGDILSPTLFSIFINDLAAKVKSLNKGIKFGNDKISILLYADDMVFLAEKEKDLQDMISAMFDWSNQWRLNVNIGKTKIIHFRAKRMA